MLCIFFYKQKPAYEMRISDWSSDVCSSDLMAGDDVAAKFVAHFQRALKIQPPSDGPLALSGAAHGFGRNIDGKPALVLVHHRQAHARTGDRRTQIDAGHVIGGAPPHAQVDRKSVV